MRRLHLALLLLLTNLVAVPAVAEVPRVLGADGTMFSLAQGEYGSLFPDGSEDAAENPVLALEIRDPQSEPTLIAVPATFGPGTEFSPLLVLENSTNTVFLLWQSWINLTQSRVLITSYGTDSAWSEVIEIAGSSFSWKSAPQIAVTHDAFDCLLDACDDDEKISRTIVHLIWQQDSERGAPVTIYAPLVLENGRYIGEHPLVVLNDLLPEAEGEAVFDAAAVAVAVQRVRLGSNGESVVIGFLDSPSGRLAAFEVRVLPGELSELGNILEVGVQEAGEGKDLGDDGDLQSVIDEARNQLIDVGARIEPGVLNRLVDATTAYLGGPQASEASLDHVASGARNQLIDVGARATERRLMRTVGEARNQLIDVGVRRQSGDETPLPHRHDLLVRPVLTVAAPELPTADWDLLLAPSGKNLLVSWSDEDAVHYRETSADGWSVTFDLDLSEKLDPSDAERILEERIRER